MHKPSNPRPDPLRLVAELAITGLNHSLLSLEEGADFYDGLSALLPSPGSEAARYAATCLRECQRARQEILSAIHAPEPTRPS
jgi:hypothetical protein